MSELPMRDERGQSGLGVVLALFGLLLMAGSVAAWFAIPEDAPRTTVIEVTRVTGDDIPATVVDEDSTTTQRPAPSPTMTVVEKTTTTTNHSPDAEKETTTTAPKPSRRSEGLFLAWFGAGFVLFLAGGFSDRIQSITGPGGIGIVLRESGKATAEALKSLEEAMKKFDSRITYANLRITELRKRVEALEERRPPPKDEEMRRVISEDEELTEAEADLASARENLAAAAAAREVLLDVISSLRIRRR